MNWLQKTCQNVPKSFRVSIDFKEDVAAQLSNKELNGISGISDSQLNAMQWFNVARKGMLMMPGEQTVALNNLSPIKYGDSDQMMQNNMELMMRIFNQRKPADVIHRLFNYVAGFVKKANTKRYANVAYFMEYTAFWQHLAWAADDIQVNSVDELAAWATITAPEVAYKKQGDWGREIMTLPLEDWKYLIQKAIEQIGYTYQDEGEWLVNDRNLKIPVGSTLYLIVPSITDDQRQMWENPEQRAMAEFLGIDKIFNEIKETKGLVNRYGLARLYRIRYVDDKRMSEQKREYYQKMDQQREQKQSNQEPSLR